jgi:hypothetical protein
LIRFERAFVFCIQEVDKSGAMSECSVCRNKGKCSPCPDCGETHYCSTAHQRLDWDAGHKDVCGIGTRVTRTNKAEISHNEWLLFDRNRRDPKKRRYLPKGQYFFQNVDWSDGDHIQMWWRDARDELRMQEFEFHTAQNFLDWDAWDKPAAPGYHAVRYPTLYQAAVKRLEGGSMQYKYADEKAEV